MKLPPKLPLVERVKVAYNFLYQINRAQGQSKAGAAVNAVTTIIKETVT